MLHAILPVPRTSIEENVSPTPVQNLPAINYAPIWETNLKGEAAVRDAVKALAEVTLFGVKSHRIATAMRTLHACLPENQTFPEITAADVSEEPAELVHL